MKLQQIGRILVYGKPVDMRNGFDGPEGIVATELGENPTSGNLFVFTNRRGLTHLFRKANRADRSLLTTTVSHLRINPPPG